MKFTTVLAASAFAISGFALLPIVAQPNNTAMATSCVTVPNPESGKSYQMQNYFSVSFSRTGTNGTATVKRLSSAPLCSDQPMVLQSYNMGPNWNGLGNTHESFISSFPQTMASAVHFTFAKDDTSKTIAIKTPAVCKGTQLDVYVGTKEYTSITGEHQYEDAEIGGMIFQPNGTCEVVKVNVCDETTGTIKQVAETDAKNYKAADSDLCKPKVQVCDSKTGEIKTVLKSEEANYEKASSDSCVKTAVCVINSGDTTMKTIFKSAFDSKTQTEDSALCKKQTVVDAPKTVEKPAPVSTPAPAAIELPHTGIAEIATGVSGLGALTYAIYSYINSRKF